MASQDHFTFLGYAKHNGATLQLIIYGEKNTLMKYTVGDPSLLKALTPIVSQNFWWPTNRRPNIRLYLKLPIPRFNNIIPCASGSY